MRLLLSLKSLLNKKPLSIKRLSIKQLTLLGFTLVALPLVASLLYSALQVNNLSKQSASAIFNVAQLIETNRKLTETRNKMERYASQFSVLHDNDLLVEYTFLEKRIPEILATYSSISDHARLKQLTDDFLQQVDNIHTLLLPEVNQNLSLSALQHHFIKLASINQTINKISNDLISQQAQNIKYSADHVSFTMLKSLIIIPITLIIAGIFIVLITKPLKRLTTKIQRLEKGNFKQKIVVGGSTEIKEIADALEMMRTRLHALELQKSSFIRHISHELKTPLAAIREGTELLYDNSVGSLNSEQQEISEIIRMSVTKLQQLIEDLLNFNVVLDSTSLQDSEKLNVMHQISVVLNERKLDIKRKNISLDIQCDDFALYSNAKQLNVILDNLLSNAIKYSEQNGKVSIIATLNEDTNELNLTLSDQGMGISAEVQNKIFDAFYQGPAPEEHQIKGSGLGLTIVKELLMRLNGDIAINSRIEAPSGTDITLTLPRAYIADVNAHKEDS